MDPRYAEGANYPPCSDSCETPREFFERLDTEFSFHLDAFADDENKLCRWYCTPERSAFDHAWHSSVFDRGTDYPLRVFLNPPYSSPVLGKAIRRAADQAHRFECTAVALVPPSSDTAWWHEVVLREASEIRFVRGRLSFCYRGEPITTLDTKTGRIRKGSNRGASAIIIFRPGVRGPIIRSMDA